MSCCETTTTIELVRNQTKSFIITVEDGDGARVDLTGGRLTLTVKRNAHTPNAVISKSSLVSGEIDIQTPQTDEDKKGKATVYFVPADTVDLPRGNYVYDLWVVLASGEQYPLITTTPFVVADPVTHTP